ncbi:hypothetical protein G7K_2152-t1 [Saitoella complicata NRRL Y-17804]|uniref:Uncharacterized protein n=1 Tax=Saitoella complicata (strain BCRC 22490 / CBS 7301 / JCM 7358 / NBRC 10748 / NRRL Y-17804) TaxID=698492 RepID=A0A0E9NDS4_SAICN|nr:hypothetical protein G7K_2152-t1 [Saitoella complicata NRRL Y-17804]
MHYCPPNDYACNNTCPVTYLERGEVKNPLIIHREPQMTQRTQYETFELLSSCYLNSCPCNIIIFVNPHLLYLPQAASVQGEPLRLTVEHSPRLLSRHRNLKQRLMHIRIKLLLQPIKPNQAMPLQRPHHNLLGHLQPRIQIHQLLVACGIGTVLDGNGVERALKVIDGFDEVFCEFLDGEVFCGFHVAGCSVLEVTEIGDGAEKFVLCVIMSVRGFTNPSPMFTHLQVLDLLILRVNGRGTLRLRALSSGSLLLCRLLCGLLLGVVSGVASGDERRTYGSGAGSAGECSGE